VFIIGFRKKWLKNNFSAPKYKRIIKQSSYVTSLGRLHPKRFFSDIQHWFPWPENSEYSGAKRRFAWPTEPVPKNNHPSKPICPEALMVGTYICDDNRFSLPNSAEGFRPKSNKFHTTLEGDVSRKSFKRLHRYRYSPAAAYGNNEVHLHPVLPRRLTVREAMMIQSVPDKYVMPEGMSLTNKFKTIGNGVPVKMADAIAIALVNFIKGDSV